MSNLVLGRISLAVGALLSVAALPVTAASSVEESLALSMSKGIRDRMFWNLQVVSTKTKTKSEEPRDITGPVVRLRDLGSAADFAEYVDSGTITDKNSVLGHLVSQMDDIVAAAGGGPLSDADLAKVLAIDVKINAYGAQVIPGLTAAIAGDYADGNANNDEGLGTPKGIKAKSGDPSATVALSVGYYLDDANKWAVEALLLGAPLKASVYGAGVRSGSAGDFGITGKEIIQTKMLPPMVKFGYSFGDRDWVVRPYVGMAAMYALFFDTKATKKFNDYQGGQTSVSIKNAFGIGPILGLTSGDLNDTGWRVGFSVGKIKLKTEATLVTRGTMITSNSAVTEDYGPQTVNAIKVIGEQNAKSTAQLNLSGYLADNGLAPGSATVFDQGVTTELMKDLAAYKATKGGDGTLGTFVRKQKTTLDNTILMLSVGRSF